MNELLSKRSRHAKIGFRSVHWISGGGDAC